MLTRNVVSLASGNMRNFRSWTTGSAALATNATSSIARNTLPQRGRSNSVASVFRNGRIQRAIPCLVLGFWLRKSPYVAHGVMEKAIASDAIIAIGTLIGMGRMYGPIIPVTKSMGRNESMTVSVASAVGLPISRTARIVASAFDPAGSIA